MCRMITARWSLINTVSVRMLFWSSLSLLVWVLFGACFIIVNEVIFDQFVYLIDLKVIAIRPLYFHIAFSVYTTCHNSIFLSFLVYISKYWCSGLIKMRILVRDVQNYILLLTVGGLRIHMTSFCIQKHIDGVQQTETEHTSLKTFLS